MKTLEVVETENGDIMIGDINFSAIKRNQDKAQSVIKQLVDKNKSLSSELDRVNSELKTAKTNIKSLFTQTPTAGGYSGFSDIFDEIVKGGR